MPATSAAFQKKRAAARRLHIPPHNTAAGMSNNAITAAGCTRPISLSEIQTPSTTKQHESMTAFTTAVIPFSLSPLFGYNTSPVTTAARRISMIIDISINAPGLNMISFTISHEAGHVKCEKHSENGGESR